jgi:hypothetical protein
LGEPLNKNVRRHKLHSRALQPLLLAAFAVPFTYFGAQIAAALFFPDYSALTVSVSDLGSNRSTMPAVLNRLLAACVASIGLAAAWAGLHPLPSTHHDPGAFGAGMFAAPFVSALAAWQVKLLYPLRWPLLLNLAVFGGCAWILSGAADVNLAAYGGLAQKLVAAVCFAPPSAIAFLAFKLLGSKRCDA